MTNTDNQRDHAKCTFCGGDASGQRIEFHGGYHVPETHESCKTEIAIDDLTTEAVQAVVDTFEEHGSVTVRDFDVDVGDEYRNWDAGDKTFTDVNQAIDFVTVRGGQSMRVMGPTGTIRHNHHRGGQ